MEITLSTLLERDKIPSPGTSPAADDGSPPPHLAPTPPLTPRTTSPYPTTFVQADTSNFKQMVQMLTGSSETARSPADPTTAGVGGGIPPIRSTIQKKQGFKLYERRNSLKNGLIINTLIPAGISSNSSGFSPRKPEILSPGMVDFPCLTLNPPTPTPTPTPMNGDSLSRSAATPSPTMEEEKAIAEKKFYFHPSPRTKSGEPQLLPLFPVTSPRVSGSDN